ncbi:MAG: hypothetical protein GX589_11340 [Deltaproteobacteria bacterium]|nr:hypothetical protein [Deltaproteobacteria bacterium]
MNTRFKALIATAKERAKLVSTRERIALGLMLVLAFVWVIYKFYGVVSNAFLAQSARLSTANSNCRALPFVLERNFKLESRKKAIEKAYQEAQVISEPLAQLETLLKSKPAIDRSFSINDSEPRRFGGKYEQHTFTVRFNISDYPQLVDLLKELTGGPKPFMLKEIKITKTRGGQRLEVGLEVSSIKRIEA